MTVTTQRPRNSGLIDKLDFEIISLMVPGYENKEISRLLGIPLSTVQRRARNIIKSGLVEVNVKPNFRKIGLKKGLIHVYVSNGNIVEIAASVSKMDGVLSLAVHVGNSDVVGEFAYEDSEQLIDTIVKIKKLADVERVLWSEEVYIMPVDPQDIVKSFKKMLNNSPYNNNNGNGK